jgi:hypothetical protein
LTFAWLLVKINQLGSYAARDAKKQCGRGRVQQSKPAGRPDHRSLSKFLGVRESIVGRIEGP